MLKEKKQGYRSVYPGLYYLVQNMKNELDKVLYLQKKLRCSEEEAREAHNFLLINKGILHDAGLI